MNTIAEDLTALLALPTAPGSSNHDKLHALVAAVVKHLAGTSAELEAKVDISPFDPRRWGAGTNIVNGVRDDTAAFQAAIDAAIACNTCPVITGLGYASSYLIRDTLRFVAPEGVPQFSFGLKGSGLFNQILWQGGSNKAVFSMLGGSTGCLIEGIKVVVPSAYHHVTVWETATSSGGFNNLNTWNSCWVDLQTGVNNVAWRMDHTMGQGADISFFRWNDCKVAGGQAIAGQRGWCNEGANTFNLVWNNCLASNLSVAWSNVSTPGATSNQGGGSMFWYGCGTSRNEVDLEVGNVGTYAWYGGRFELGKRILQAGFTPNQPVISFYDIEVGGYNPPNGCLFACDRPASLLLQNLQVGSDQLVYDSRIVYMGGSVNGERGTLHVLGGGYRGTTAIFTGMGDQVDVYVQGVKLLDSDFGPRTIVPETATKTLSANYTVQVGDYRNVLEATAALRVTLPLAAGVAAATPLGATLALYQLGSGEVTISAPAGVSVRCKSSTLDAGHVARLLYQHGRAVLYHQALNNWVLSGDVEVVASSAGAATTAATGTVIEDTDPGWTFNGSWQLVSDPNYSGGGGRNAAPGAYPATYVVPQACQAIQVWWSAQQALLSADYSLDGVPLATLSTPAQPQAPSAPVGLLTGPFRAGQTLSVVPSAGGYGVVDKLILVPAS